MSALESWESSRPINLLKTGVESPSFAEFSLMEVLNTWELPTSRKLVNLCGLTISWFPVLVGETVVPTRTGGVHPGGPYSNVTMARGTNAPSCPDYQTWSLESPRISECHVHDDLRYVRRRDLDRRRSGSRNLVVNPRVNRSGDDWEGPADQSFLLQIYVASVSISNFSFLSVTSVSSNLWITYRIAFCIMFV